MSLLFVLLVCLYPLLGGGGLIAFVRAARRTDEDWEQHPAVRQMELALRRAVEQDAREAKCRISSRAGQA